MSPISNQCNRVPQTLKVATLNNTSFCYYIKCFDDGVYEPKLVSYTGEDEAQTFVEMLEEDITEITSIPEKKMIFGEKEKERFDKETKYWI